MHETIIARRLIGEAEKQGDVAGITLEIGELAHVPSPELVACIRQLVPGWKLSWKEMPSMVKCSGCGFTGHPTVLERGHDSFLIACPKCRMLMPDVVAGTEVKLVSVEVRD
ncbi:TPA: hydrogenase maturation nickel metallochaperone HypA [Candidatus Woesearchaeota archaeon]|nr:hydrogenase maturation nickel metallochaperone HypA [Candidatus Woesearchaeota archaeon]HII69537.1 hydrogenase maturation nickel metallochaperone HypA [Candidatus Woesearchaeota archaeon]